MGLGDFLSGLGETLVGALEAVAPVAGAIVPQIVQQRGLERSLRRLPRFEGPFGQGFVEGGLGDLFPGLPGATGDLLRNLVGAPAMGGGCPVTTTRPTVRPVREFRCQHPTTGKILSWRYQGMPLLYSGDRSAAKRYAKMTGQTLRRRASGSRPTTRRRRR